MKAYKCRNCGAVMTSEDFRYQCSVCGYCYIIAFGMLIEPESQRPAGAPAASLIPLEDLEVHE